ncbi:hypothetical protein DASC09_010620 [Saccharomycopsis crataegensis]|uniref:Uncharacterized protein n=1 Tax=Saccharomycopsis crataegensis TaxID=43959 RepID=A0AAV5QGL4_9ASCO|nr:hypothetical protein DASC09_010620 [Saccharomycopsis crataegensis]
MQAIDCTGDNQIFELLPNEPTKKAERTFSNLYESMQIPSLSYSSVGIFLARLESSKQQPHRTYKYAS